MACLCYSCAAVAAVADWCVVAFQLRQQQELQQRFLVEQFQAQQQQLTEQHEKQLQQHIKVSRPSRCTVHRVSGRRVPCVLVSLQWGRHWTATGLTCI